MLVLGQRQSGRPNQVLALNDDLHPIITSKGEATDCPGPSLVMNGHSSEQFGLRDLCCSQGSWSSEAIRTNSEPFPRVPKLCRVYYIPPVSGRSDSSGRLTSLLVSLVRYKFLTEQSYCRSLGRGYMGTIILGTKTGTNHALPVPHPAQVSSGCVSKHSLTSKR